MRQNIRFYFKLFDTVGLFDTRSHWEENPTLGGIVLGILLFPIFVPLYILWKILSIKISL